MIEVVHHADAITKTVGIAPLLEILPRGAILVAHQPADQQPDVRAPAGRDPFSAATTGVARASASRTDDATPSAGGVRTYIAALRNAVRN